MAFTKLILYNGALRILAESSVTLAEDREPRYKLDEVWAEDPIRYCLARSQWQWASRRVKLSYDVAVEPEFGHRRAFEKPDDFVKLVQICSDESFRNEVRDFAYEKNYFFTHYDDIYMQYVSDDNVYGRDYSLWPESFGKLVQHYMAKDCASRILGIKTDVEKINALYDQALKVAEDEDALFRPTKKMPQGGWSKGRMGQFRNRSDVE